VLLGIYIVNNSLSGNISGQQEEASEFDTIKDPIERYVTECLHLTGYDAIIEIGEHAGFSDLSRNNINYDPMDPTNSDAVVMSIAGSTEASTDFFAIPYYWYMISQDGCQNDCQFLISFPELYKTAPEVSIESELDHYMNDNLEKCINDFEDFRKAGYNITVLDLPEVDSRVNDNTISFSLYYPIEIKQKDNQYKLDKYYTEQDIDFKEIFDLALEVTAIQAKYRFLEYQALNLVGGYSGIDNELPPISDSTFDFGDPGEVWVKTDVANTMKAILVKYVHALRAIGTNNYVSLSTGGISDKLMDHQMQIELSREYDLDVYFNYLDIWPMYFDLDNCDGEICKPSSWSNTLLLLIGNQRYRFYYSMAYPVLVKVHDDKAFNGEGYNFYFFLESNIKYNNVLMAGGNSSFTGTIGSGKSLLCNDNQRNSGVFNLTAIDASTEKPVKDISLYYACGTESCTIELLDNGSFSGKFPVCAGGYISLVKEGYMTKSTLLSTSAGKGMDIGELKVEPLIKRNLTVNKLKFVKPLLEPYTPWTKSGESGLERNQEATVILTKIQDTGEDQLVQFVTINYTTQYGEVSLVPGEYNVQVILLDKSEIVIPEEERETGGLFSQDYTMPRFEFNDTSPWLLGGVDGNFTLSRSLLESNGVLKVNAIAFELGDVTPDTRRQIEDLNMMSQTANYTNMYNAQLGFR